MHESQIIDYFEAGMKAFIRQRLSHVNDWMTKCIPPEIRDEMALRKEREEKFNDLLNKPSYDTMQYIDFDGYERIISRKDNWREYFEGVFRDKIVFTYKMRVLQSLRNDVRHGRPLNTINKIRLRVHSYDILAQVYESGMEGADNHDIMMQKFGLVGMFGGEPQQ